MFMLSPSSKEREAECNPLYIQENTYVSKFNLQSKLEEICKTEQISSKDVPSPLSSASVISGFSLFLMYKYNIYSLF